MAQGTVKWFSNESDYGYMYPDDGGQDIHVRRRHILGDELESLEKGYRVTYEMPQNGRGLWATGVSKEEQRCYSWRDDCFERHEGKEARHATHGWKRAKRREGSVKTAALGYQPPGLRPVPKDACRARGVGKGGPRGTSQGTGDKKADLGMSQ